MTSNTSPLKLAHDKLLTLPHNLLACEPNTMGKYKMIWSPATWFNNEKREKTKGIWTDGVRTSPVFPLWGVIDGKKSQLGDYGNCWYDKESGVAPKRAALLKSKFTVHITYPKLPPHHADEPFAKTVSNQIYCMDAIQDNAVAALASAGEEELSSTDWARFEQTEDGTAAWLSASIGSVYESKSKKVKGKEVTNRALVQAPGAPEITKPDIVDDGLGFLASNKGHNLKHNELLPCFLPNGERIGRCASELRRELYDGRWVRLDVELVMWNMKAEGKRIFQLQVVRLEVLPASPASMDGMAFASLNPKDYKSLTAASGEVPPSAKASQTDVEKKDGKKAAEASKSHDKKDGKKTAEDGKSQGDDDDETYSESSDKSKNKRVANGQLGGTPKK